jgi:hypothetical protein
MKKTLAERVAHLEKRERDLTAIIEAGIEQDVLIYGELARLERLIRRKPRASKKSKAMSAARAEAARLEGKG